MSSGFVSGGTTDQPIERDDEWLKAQQEIEARHLKKEEESREQGGKSLYEVLQGNKAAKQDAFEESIRLKNQFRNLDEDEVEFLDSVLESTRRKEQEVKKQTSEQLDLFRRQQEEADRAVIEGNDGGIQASGNSLTGEPEEKWTVNRGKRKRGEDKKGLPGFKLRKSSSSTQDGGVDASVKIPSTPTKATTEPQSKTKVSSATTTLSSTTKPDTMKSLGSATDTARAKPSNLGLAGYSSEEDD